MRKINPNSFFLGIVCTLAVFAVFSFTTSNSESTRKASEDHIESMKNISPQTAMMYRNNYNMSNSDGLKGINLSVQQLEMINAEVAARGTMNNLSGFRLYYGAKSQNSNSEIVSMLYTVNNSLQENSPGNSLLMAEGFSRSYSQQCPPFCD